MRTVVFRLTYAMRDLSSENVALALAAGLVLGIFPMYGVPTILCILASFTMRVNFPALQIVNQLSWPLQVVLLMPFARLGSRMVPASGFAATIAGRVGLTILQAVAGWVCVGIPLGLLLYFSLVYILRRNASYNAALIAPI
jgi:uncharacterized protein (DUF2062 family)